MRVGCSADPDGDRILPTGGRAPFLDFARAFGGGTACARPARTGAPAPLGRLDEPVAENSARAVLLSSRRVVGGAPPFARAGNGFRWHGPGPCPQSAGVCGVPGLAGREEFPATRSSLGTGRGRAHEADFAARLAA